MTKNIMIKMSSQGNEVLKGQACRKRHTSSTGLQLKFEEDNDSRLQTKLQA